jgi:hypothetical protein
VWSSVAFTKEASEIMKQQLHGRGVLSLRAADKWMTAFQQIFASFCVFITDSCILLFFSKLASKFEQLLITTTTPATNQIQREFLFNNAIHSQNLFSASSYPLQKTNFYKPACCAFIFILGVLGDLAVHSFRLPFCPNTRLEAQGSATYNARTKI